MRRAGCVIGALLAVLWSVPLGAQQATGTVRGRVTDEATRRPLSGVTVAVGTRAAVTQVSSAEFNTGRIITPQQLIQSKVAGVQLVDNNEPGGGITLRVRGANSVTASSDPLYVIDGMPVGLANTNPPNVLDPSAGLSAGRDPLNFLNPDDIESITVLRDASAAAIYGVNAASGVVIIKTKSGQQGPPRVEYS